MTPETFDHFCLRTSARLVSAIALYAGGREVAEDVAQEALARAFLHWHEVRVLDAPEAWLHHVAINLTRSWHRRLRNARRHPESPRIAEHPDQLERRDELRRALLRLTPRQRHAVVLRHYADMSVRDVAVAMGCAEGTVRALTAQGIASLREGLESGDG